MNVTAKLRDRNPDIELLFQVLRIGMDEVIRSMTFVDERIVHVEQLDTRSSFAETGQMRIIFPEDIGGGANVRFKLPGIGGVKVSDGGGQHDHIARTLI